MTGGQRIEELRERYAFDEWRGARASDECLLVWRFRLSGLELPGWVAHRIQTLRPAGMPPATVSLWQDARETHDALLSVAVFECDSREAAHEQMLRLLGELEGVGLERRDGPGDVAFGSGDGVLLFARGNMALLVHGDEARPALALDAAARLDRLLAARPAPVPEGPAITEFRPAGDAAAGAAVPLVVAAEAPPGRDVWFKLYTRSGELRIEGGRPVYMPAAEARLREVTAYALDRDGSAGAERLRLGGSLSAGPSAAAPAPPPTS